MNAKNFLNYHVLISHSPSCLNRDDMNMQKSAVFGGARRVRVSSQSLKRAMRKSGYYEQELGSPSDRTIHLGMLRNKYVDLLSDRFHEDLVTRTLGLIAGKDATAGDAKADAVAPWSITEVERLCEIVRAADEKSLDPKKLEKLVSDESASLRASAAKAVDIALSGRMATSGLMTKIDGAMAVAHSITTHAVDADIDWFTAVDDLVEEEGEVGAGHLNTQEFSSGVFYRYASLNIGQLMTNMGADRKAALDVAAHMARLMATVVPDAKRNSFGQDNPADFLFMSFSDMPLSFANAFEKPIQSLNGSGFLTPSLRALEDYMERVHKGYGIDERHKVFSLSETAIAPRVKSFAELMDWIRGNGE